MDGLGLMLRLGRRFPFERRVWVRRTAIHLSLSLAFSITHLALMSFVLAVVVAALSQGGRSRGLEIGGDLAFVVCCAVSSFCFLALFARFAGVWWRPCGGFPVWRG